MDASILTNEVEATSVNSLFSKYEVLIPNLSAMSQLYIFLFEAILKNGKKARDHTFKVDTKYENGKI